MEATKFEVKVISSETIKPSSPTPPHLQKLTLSFLDQIYTPHLAPGLLFFRAPKASLPLDVTLLKTCFSSTLSCFYPLAGQYETWGTLSCNDHGVPFVVAHVDCTLDRVLESCLKGNKVDFLSFYPPKDGILSSRIHMAIQVNLFACGGYALARYYTHKAMDGISSAMFFRHWSALVTRRHEVAAQVEPDFNAGPAVFPPVPEKGNSVEVARPALTLVTGRHEVAAQVEPDFNAGPAVFPPVPEKGNSVEVAKPALKDEDKKKSSWDFKFEKTIGVKSFLFKDETINKLKALASSDKVTNPSRFEALTGFIWKHILLGSPNEGHSMLKIPVNLRPKTNPPLPSGSIGNLFRYTHAKAHNRADLHDMVYEIRDSVSKIESIAQSYQGEKRSEENDRINREFIDAVIKCKGKDIYFVNSLCRSTGFNDIDFGYGKPEWMVPFDDATNHNKINGIILTDCTGSNGDGIEAWLFLEEDTLEFLGSNTQFLEFATLNYSSN